MYHKVVLVGVYVLLVLGGMALLGAVSAWAGVTFTVDDTADALDANPGDGLCATSGGACTLRAAIMETNELAGDDTIILPSGMYTLTIGGPGEDMATFGDLDVTDNLTITGAGAESTIIDGNGRVIVDRVMHIVGSDVKAVISGVTVRNGGEDGYGYGGMQVEGDLKVSDSVIADNVGSGISARGILTMTNCTVSNNTCGGMSTGVRAEVTDSTISGNGCGGVHNGGVLTMVDTVVSDNTATGGMEGGGINNRDGTVTLINCTIRDNTTESEGGGIYNDSWTFTVISSTISGNVALCRDYDHGGGGIFSIGSLEVADSTISSNIAVGQSGGGIRAQGTLHLTNTTISGNRAGSAGGGLLATPDTSTYLNNVSLTGNTADDGGGIRVTGDAANVAIFIIAGNFDSSPETNHPDCSGTLISSQGYNLIQDTNGCFIGGDTTGNLTGVDPLMDPLNDNGGPTLTHALLPGSPAINAGNPAGCTDHQGNPLLTDQRGIPRVGRCDMGAYETMPPDPYRKTASLSATLPGEVLTYTISLENLQTVDITGLRVTDTLPSLVTYLDHSLTATGGSYGYADGVVTWTGAVSAGGTVAVKFGVTVSQTASLGTTITNSALISGGGEIITRTAAVFVGHRIYLPLITKDEG